MRRPWNIPDLPVYSLATYIDGRLNMNICTYVSAVSMKPKQYLVAVYKNTRTLENLERGGMAVLQVLHQDQFGLINTLGKKSGNRINKQSYLDKKGYLENWNNYLVLKHAVAWVELNRKNVIDSGGDHLLYLFDVLKFKSNLEQGVLTTQFLIKKGLIL